MCWKLRSIYQRTVIIAISVAGPFIGQSIELCCLNIFLTLLQFGKENEQNNEFNQTLFFSLLYLLGLFIFNCRIQYISELFVFALFLLYINRITICIMGYGSFQQFRECQSQSYTYNQKTRLTKYLTDESVQFFFYHFFVFKREGGSCHSPRTRLLHLLYFIDNYIIINFIYTYWQLLYSIFHQFNVQQEEFGNFEGATFEISVL